MNDHIKIDSSNQNTLPANEKGQTENVTFFNKSFFKLSLTFAVFSLFAISGALLYISNKISQSSMNTQSFAQVSSLQQQSSSTTSANDLQGTKEKLGIFFSYNYKTDTLIFDKIEGKRGYVFGEFAQVSSPDFDIIAFDNQSNPLFQTIVEVKDEYSDARDEGDMKMFQDGFSTYNSTNSPTKIKSGTSLNAIVNQNPLIFGSKLSNQENLPYFAELEYSSSIDHIEIVPHEGNDKRASLLIDPNMIDHIKINQEIASTKFNNYKSRRFQGMSDPDSIGILFVSDNYNEEEMNEFYSYVEYFKKELSENNVLRNYMNKISITAVQGKTGLEKRCSGLGLFCKGPQNDVELRSLMNQYKTDVLVMVYKRTEEEVQSAQGLNIPCRAAASGNIVLICDGFNGPLAVLTHEMGHALLNLRDEYPYSSFRPADLDRNCTYDTSCSVWSHIPNDGCYQNCTSSAAYRGNNGYLMEGILIKDKPVNDYGPVGSYYATQTLNDALSPSPTPTVTPPMTEGCEIDCTCDNPALCDQVSTCTQDSGKSCALIGGKGFCCPIER